MLPPGAIFELKIRQNAITDPLEELTALLQTPWVVFRGARKGRKVKRITGREGREGRKGKGEGRRWESSPLLCLHYLTNGVCQYPCDCVRLTAASGRSECSCGNSSPEERCRTPTSRTGKWPTSCSPANGCSSLPTARTACKRSLILISTY